MGHRAFLRAGSTCIPHPRGCGAASREIVMAVASSWGYGGMPGANTKAVNGQPFFYLVPTPGDEILHSAGVDMTPASVVLDGRPYQLRGVTPTDASALVEFGLRGLSDESRALFAPYD
eukprot:5711416-Prymnesium_polylepis.1